VQALRKASIKTEAKGYYVGTKKKTVGASSKEATHEMKTRRKKVGDGGSNKSKGGGFLREKVGKQ